VPAEEEASSHCASSQQPKIEVRQEQASWAAENQALLNCSCHGEGNEEQISVLSRHGFERRLVTQDHPGEAAQWHRLASAGELRSRAALYLRTHSPPKADLRLNLRI
jgi:hypothetical protein